MKRFDLICIIDDDPIFVFAVQKLIESESYGDKFLIFNDGLEAIEGLSKIISNDSEDIPDVILLDINMPVMDGWQFLDEFTQIQVPKKVVVFIVSSSIDPADHNKAQEYSMVSNFIVKPINKSNLEKMVETLR